MKDKILLSSLIIKLNDSEYFPILTIESKHSLLTDTYKAHNLNNKQP